jgi:hypothetical protein
VGFSRFGALRVSGPTTLLDKWRFLQALCADEELSATAKVVAVRLLDHFNGGSGRCSPSYETLARGIGLRRRRTIDAVKALEDSGWFAIEHVKGGDPKATKGYVTNTFRPSFDRVPPVQDAALPPGAGSCTPGVQDRALPPGAGSCTQNLETDNPQMKPEETTSSGKPVGRVKAGPSEAELDASFARWWPRYPRKDDKKAARRKFGVVVRSGEVTVEELIAGADAYRAECVADGKLTPDGKPTDRGRFIKTPEVWLNKGSWSNAHNPALALGSNPPQNRKDARDARTEHWKALWSDDPGLSPNGLPIIDGEAELVLP